jgi:hypothetical protein
MIRRNETSLNEAEVPCHMTMEIHANIARDRAAVASYRALQIVSAPSPA